MIGYPSHAAALTASARHMRRGPVALQLEDGSWAAGLGYTCGEQHLRRAGLLPDGQVEQIESAEGRWRLAGHAHGPGVHWSERDRASPPWSVVPLHQRVPLRYAVTLTWRQPDGHGRWLVVERGAIGTGQADTLEGISDAGVVTRRARTERDAADVATDLQRAARRRGAFGAHYEAVHEGAAEMLESDRPYGVYAAEVTL